MSKLGSWRLPTSRGDATEHATYTGRDGEISVNTDNHSIRIHDGVTPGGNTVPGGDLDFPGGASLVGTLSGESVQWELDNNPGGGGGDPLLRADLLAPGGVQLVGNAALQFNNVASMMGADWLNAGDVVLTGGTIWNVYSDAGLDAGTFITLQNNLAAIQVTPTYVGDFGITPSNTPSENSDAWDVMWALLPNLSSPGPTYDSVGDLHYGEGTYEFERPWELKKFSRQFGKNSGFNGVASWTIISFSGNDANAVTINRFNTLNGGVEGTPSGRADGTVLNGLSFQARNRVYESNGLWLRARAKIVDCTFAAFGGWGLKILASAGAVDPALEGNANNWVIDTVACIQNGVSGLLNGGGMYVEGADVNIGNATNLDCSSNQGRGLFDSSFLGNTYTGSHWATNGVATGDDGTQVHHQGSRYYLNDPTPGIGSITEPGTDNEIWVFYKLGSNHSIYPDWTPTATYTVGWCVHTDNLNARNEFLGCYTEGSQPPCNLSAPDKVYGGIMSGGGAGFVSQSTHFVISADTNGTGVISPLRIYGKDIGSSVALGGTLTRQNALQLNEPGGTSNGLSFQNKVEGQWGWSISNGPAFHGIYTDLAQDAAGRVGQFIQPNTFYVGNEMVLGFGGAARHFGRITDNFSLLDGLVFARGDLYFISNPVAGGTVGIVFTTGGIAGSTAVFKEFGAIGA